MTENIILRRKVSRSFTTLPNDLIRDKQLSWKALGQLVFLLSLPPSFRLSLAFLTKQKKCGRDATRAGLKELENAGYLSIEQLSDESGRFSHSIWQISDTPHQQGYDAPCSENPNTDLPEVDFPQPEKPTLINTNREQILKEKITTTTREASAAHQTTFTLSFHRSIPKEDRPALKLALAKIPEPDRQALLDELAASMMAGAIKTTPLRWLHGLINHYLAGRFTPSLGQSIANLRATELGASPTEQSPKSQRTAT